MVLYSVSLLRIIEFSIIICWEEGMSFNIKEVKLEIYVPEEYVVPIRETLTQIGACRVGNYDHVVSYHGTKGSWRPLTNSSPYSGKIGEICCGEEVKMEVRCPIEILEEAVTSVRKIHPYEEPVINIIPLLNIPPFI